MADSTKTQPVFPSKGNHIAGTDRYEADKPGLTKYEYLVALYSAHMLGAQFAREDGPNLEPAAIMQNAVNMAHLAIEFLDQTGGAIVQPPQGIQVAPQ